MSFGGVGRALRLPSRSSSWAGQFTSVCACSYLGLCLAILVALAGSPPEERLPVLGSSTQFGSCASRRTKGGGHIRVGRGAASLTCGVPPETGGAHEQHPIQEGG